MRRRGEDRGHGGVRARPPLRVTVATGGSRELLGRAVAIEPSGSGAMPIGEVSASAQAQGVRAGMALGEALGHCRELELIPGDPVKVEQAWNGAVRSLEGIGALLSLLARVSRTSLGAGWKGSMGVGTG